MITHVDLPPGYTVQKRPEGAVDKRAKAMGPGFDSLDCELWAREQDWYPRVIARSFSGRMVVWWLEGVCNCCERCRRHCSCANPLDCGEPCPAHQAGETAFDAAGECLACSPGWGEAAAAAAAIGEGCDS